MNLAALVIFSVCVLATFYLYFLSARQLGKGRIGATAVFAVVSVISAAASLYSGVLTIQPAETQGFLSPALARSLFHIAVWPWLVPISLLGIFMLWLAAKALRAFAEHALKRALGLSVGVLACLLPLAYCGFVLSFFVLFTGAPKTEAELIAEFERSTGLAYPQEATVRAIRTHRSDSFGDWEGSLVFQVPSMGLDVYRQVPRNHWQSDTRWKIWNQSDCCDWEISKFPHFLPPDGAMFVVDDEGHYKFLALDHRSGTVYFLRSSW